MRTSVQISIPRLERYLSSVLRESVKVVGFETLGVGWHAETYRIIAEVRGKRRSFVLKILRGERGFGHDYPSDRASVLLMAHKDFNVLPNHVRSIDVGYFDKYGDMHSVGDYEEFFILMEEARGEPYINDLRRILREGELRDVDRARLRILVDYLVRIHSVRFSGGEETMRRLYLRRVRDLVGHGEMIMGVVDSAYPFESPYDDKLREVESLALQWRWRLRRYYRRLCQVHGDYHPFNIRFHDNELIVMDRSRGAWGEPADDVTCLASNYLWHALLHRGRFEGPFAELMRELIRSYVNATGDEEIFKVMQPWLAFRCLVIASPLFYPENPESVRQALLRFAVNVMKVEVFSLDMVNYLLRE